MTVPYKDSEAGKKQQVAEMFNKISKKYDFLNHFLSLGMDIYWRKRAISLLRQDNPKLILDIATGTGDFAIEALKLNPEQVIGIDISEGMLQVGREKIMKTGYDNVIELKLGDSEKLLFEDNKFDSVIVAFGVRNFEELEVGLENMYRVLKPGGKTVILEFSRPHMFPFKQIYDFYFKLILPKIGRIISGDISAYKYLPESVLEFPHGDKFLKILENVGFKNNKCIPLTFGISSIYIGQK